MSTAHEHYSSSEGTGHLYDGGEKLLSFAEQLAKDCEQYERRQKLLVLLYASSSVLATLAVSGMLFLLLNYGLAETRTACIFLLTFTLIMVMVSLNLRLHFPFAVKQLRRDRRALLEIADLLREVEKALAERNNLSVLERAAFRIRLARLDIGSGDSPR